VGTGPAADALIFLTKVAENTTTLKGPKSAVDIKEQSRFLNKNALFIELLGFIINAIVKIGLLFDNNTNSPDLRTISSRRYLC